MFKAVLKKNRDGSKGSKKDSGMWMMGWKTERLFSGNSWPHAAQFMDALRVWKVSSVSLMQTQTVFKDSEGRLKL